MALDFFDGYTGGIDRVVEDYRAGVCDIGGRRLTVRDINFVKGCERSFYIGSKEAGKETNVYEKGDQLFGTEAGSDWLRFELRYGNKLRVISSDILRRPADFFAGASTWHASVLAEAGQAPEPEAIKVNPRLPIMTVEAECVRNVRWAFQTAAATVSAAFKYLGDDAFLSLVSSTDLPARLRRFKPAELSQAFMTAGRRFTSVAESSPVLH